MARVVVVQGIGHEWSGSALMGRDDVVPALHDGVRHGSGPRLTDDDVACAGAAHGVVGSRRGIGPGGDGPGRARHPRVPGHGTTAVPAGPLRAGRAVGVAVLRHVLGPHDGARPEAGAAVHERARRPAGGPGPGGGGDRPRHPRGGRALARLGRGVRGTVRAPRVAGHRPRDGRLPARPVPDLQPAEPPARGRQGSTARRHPPLDEPHRPGRRGGGRPRTRPALGRGDRRAGLERPAGCDVLTPPTRTGGYDHSQLLRGLTDYMALFER
jgi:hypothetical protein